MAANKGAPRAPRLTPQQIADEEARRKARRAEQRKAAKAAKQATLDELARQAKPPAPTPEDEQAAEALQHARNVEAAKAEAEATGMSFEEACDSMGINADGTLAKGEPKRRYDGPMLALVAARKAYVTAPNGQPCNGDLLAQVCGAFTREQVHEASR